MKRFVFILVLISLGALSCGKHSVVRKYYVLEIPMVSDTTGVFQLINEDATLEVAPAIISPPFADRRIAIRIRDHELTYFLSHLWATTPRDAITNLLETYFQRSGLFLTVSSKGWKILPRYELTTFVHQLEVVQNRKRFVAHLQMEWFLRDTKLNKVVVYHNFDRYEIIPRKDLNLFARTISNMLHTELKAFSTKIAQKLRNREAADRP